MLGAGKRSYRHYYVLGLELDNGLLIPLSIVVKNPSKHMPHQGAREKARRLKQLEK